MTALFTRQCCGDALPCACCNIKAPPGISRVAKEKMMKKINDAIDERYNHIGVTIITLGEDVLDSVMIAGHIASSDSKYEEFQKAQAKKHS
jgi:hypothetical protein